MVRIRNERQNFDDDVVSEFVRTYWGQSPFFHYGLQEIATAFAKSADIPALLSQKKRAAGRLIVTRDGVDGSPDDYATAIKAGARARDLQSFCNDFVSQALPSIVSRRVEAEYPQLGQAIKALVDDAGFKMNVNLYFSPPGGSALSAHYDRHDVFVLQLWGQKEWHLLGDDRINARAGIASANLDPPVQDPVKLILEVGYLLYLPQGIWHRAVGGPQGSVHAAIGLEPT